MRALLFSDFDFTFLPHGYPAQWARNKRAVMEFRKQGDLFGIATGRGLVSLEKEFPDYLEYLDYLITLDGAISYEVKGGVLNELSQVKIPARDVRDIVGVITRRSLRWPRDVVFFSGEEEMRKYKGGHLTKIRAWCTGEEDCAILHYTLESMGHNVISFYNVDPSMNFDIGRLKWVHDDVRHAVEIRPRGLDKGVAIRNMEQYLPRDVVVATTVGDDINDVGMVEEYDGYAVNPKPALARVLKPGHIASSLAEVIELVSP